MQNFLLIALLCAESKAYRFTVVCELKVKNPCSIGASLVAQILKNLPAVQETRVLQLVRTKRIGPANRVEFSSLTYLPYCLLLLKT